MRATTRALDVGCGSGKSLACLLNYDEIYGVDIDESVLTEAQLNYPQAMLFCASGESLPFPDAHFDLIRAQVSLPYMDIVQALTEFRRVLKRDGMIEITLHPFWFVRDFWMQAVRDLSWKTAVFYVPYIIANGLLLHFGLPQFRFPFKRSRIESFQTERGIERALSRAGFRLLAISNSRIRFMVRAYLVTESASVGDHPLQHQTSSLRCCLSEAGLTVQHRLD